MAESLPGINGQSRKAGCLLGASPVSLQSSKLTPSPPYPLDWPVYVQGQDPFNR